MPRRSYRSPLREKRAAEIRTRIVAAARDLFARRGFAATTVAMIAQHAKVAQPTVYATFGTKAAIIGAIIGEVSAHSDRETSWRQIQAEADPRAKLGLYATFMRRLYVAGRDVFSHPDHRFAPPAGAVRLSSDQGR